MKYKAATFALVVALLATGSKAVCPHAGAASDLPQGHPVVGKMTNRKLKATYNTYQEAMVAIAADLELTVVGCQISATGMKYAAIDNPVVTSASVVYPAAAWLRAFFHDAGTFVKSPAKNGPKGGPNGSIGVGCATSGCGTRGIANATDPNAICPNNAKPVDGFSDGNSYCCPRADQCVAHGLSPNSSPIPGLTVPVCLTGSNATVELCRRENANLLTVIQHMRRVQTTFTYGSAQQVSLADILVAGAVAAVKVCSNGTLSIPYTYNRTDAAQADDSPLPSPQAVIEDHHFSVFQTMGLNKVDMVTVVTGSHSIGGFRNLSSPGLTARPYVPFDCTTAGNLNLSSAPFDNNVFKVACDGVQGVEMGSCQWNEVCTSPTSDEVGCPFRGDAREAFAQGDNTSYPTPGSHFDAYMCRKETNTRQRMVQYANDQDFFFKSYAAAFAKLAKLGYQADAIAVLP